ncbi:FAD-dependent monooxygenase [Streptomyces bambusae]|uniref:FAD-dependent oxidoreductase n=1 Tax=Streptomyces bambusae TaxID=1550616 RepID=UPI001CFE1023|nr:NAD(P)/FAD-dependent oxidoreductase [Streptomyces bambusae]MCB5165702.1 FAD-dependent monooxygenase [Streptomyces bambusae]
MADRPHAVVAGGGIGGLAAAAALARTGARVTVLERAPHTGTGGGGLVLYANGVRALDAISPALGARIRAEGHLTGPDETRVVTDPHGRILASEAIGAQGVARGTPQIPVLRAVLQQALYDEATAAGATVRTGAAVTGRTPLPGGERAHLADGTAVDGDLLIAADGIHSALRRALLADGPPQYRGYTSVRGRATGLRIPHPARVVNGTGVQLFISPAGPGVLYWTAKITAPAGTWPAKGPAAALADLRAATADWDEAVRRLLAATAAEDTVVTDIHDRDAAPHWTDGRLALLGDAAHPMVPALGQGANMALEDAVVLARAVAAHPADPPRALAAYQAARLPRTSAVVLRSRAQGAVDQGDGAAGARRRDDLMRTQGRKDIDTADIHDWHPDRPEPTERNEELTDRTAPAAEHDTPQFPVRCTPGPVWRDSNVRTGPSLDSPVVQLLLPEEWVSYDADGWSEGDEVVEGEHPCGEITSSLWFRLASGGWTSAVNFEPSAVDAIVPGGSRQAAPLTSGSQT